MCDFPSWNVLRMSIRGQEGACCWVCWLLCSVGKGRMLWFGSVYRSSEIEWWR